MPRGIFAVAGPNRSLFNGALIGVVAVASLLQGACGQQQGSLLLQRERFIAHALGAIDGVSYSNSLAAAEHNYALGFRVFEVDLCLTADGELVTFHEGHEGHLGLSRPLSQVSAAEVLGLAYDGKYRLSSWSDLLRAFSHVNDAFLVTDTKRWNPPILRALLRGLEKVPAMRRRVIPQLYQVEDFALFRRHSPWPYPTFIFTLYQNSLSNEQVLALVREEKIPVVTMPVPRVTPRFVADLHSLGALVFTHTVNDHAQVMRLAEVGVDGFYTDSYRPFHWIARLAPASRGLALGEGSHP